ncbi:O-antigen/teichoic acid export membrane protein [Streptomyces sp. V4I23]|uniref:oligosaccharide flippase family protein n=1 Tax=Streptomyces sp. V4I23 TaxID=3042282 RepID=UPI00278643EB|nr:oligosaccharide flippase family protein [Streptomyces sp. V4I23]MDQ1006962.1 O-antigen/teichoic acid export membrane protein [Streptomyces sp. V4I23]
MSHRKIYRERQEIPGQELYEEKGSSTSRSLLSSITWNYICSLVSVLLTLAYTAFTGRTVDSGDYGSYAIALTATQFFSHVACAGLYSHLLRVECVTQQLLGAARRIALVSGIVCFLVTYAAAPLCAMLWKIPSVEPTLRLLALQFLFHPAATVTNATLRRIGQAKRAAGNELLGLAVGLSGGTLLILDGWNPWGLAAVPPITSAAMLIFGTTTLAHSRRRPPIGPHVRVLNLLRESGGLSVHNLVDFATSNSPLWCVARLLGPTAAGCYSRAWLFASIPRALLTQGINFTTTPAMADAQKMGCAPPVQVVHAILFGASAVAFVPFGAMAGMGPPLLELLLGPGWGSAVALVPVLAVGSALSLICSVGSSVDQVRRASRSMAVTKIAVIGGSSVAVAAAAATHSLTVFAAAAVTGPLLGHIAQLLSWRRDGVVHLRALLRAHMTHAAIGTALFVSARLVTVGHRPVESLLYGFTATVAITLGCYPLRRRLPLYAIVKRCGLLGDRTKSALSP